MGKRKNKDRPRDVAGRVLLAPEFDSRTVELSEGAGGNGLTFRKRILPLGTITYPQTRQHPGGKVTFDAKYHQTLIDSFQAGAYDDTTVQLASGGVEHNHDVKLTAGSVIAMSHEQPDDTDGPGLYATIRAHSKKDAKLFRRHPNLGVSPEIVEGRTRVDGKHFPAAIHHVLGTLRGRVVGLGPWRAISLASHDAGIVIDLAAGEYEELGKMGKKKQRELETVLALSDDDLEAALEAAADELERGAYAPPARVVSLSDTADLETRATTALTRVQGLNAKLSSQEWSAYRSDLSGGGVPKRILDLAEEILEYPAAEAEGVISLSDEDGDTFDVDPRRIVRGILEECRGIIDLSDDTRGAGGDPTARQATETNVQAALAAWTARSGD